ncbi:MAG: ribulose-phosphate 3-epimerase [Anaerolineales bacterium]
MNQFIIAPSIIAADFTHIADEIATVEAAGARWLHVDVMDGNFVPTITIGPLFTEACKRVAKIPLDVHLMIVNPENHIESFAQAGATNITVHVEACNDLKKTIEQIKSLGCQAGVTLRPATPVSAIESVFSLVDLVLVMSVNPGYSGQAFMPEMIDRVREIRGKLDGVNPKAHLEVDGGISVKTLPLMKAAGANAFVTGNAAFKHPEGTAAGVGELVRVSVA